MKKYFERMRGHEKFTQPRTQGLPRANAGHVTPKYSQNLGVFLYIIKTPIGSQGE
jgi:hypothetical protein